MRSGRMPRRTHQTESAERRPRACVANGTPLSERMRDGQAVLVKGADEDGPTLGDLRAGEGVAAEEEATVAVGDRERIAERAVAQAKLAFEVGGPDGVRARPSALAVARHGPGRRTRRGGDDKPGALEMQREGAARGPGRGGPLLAHEAEELPRSPARMVACGRSSSACDQVGRRWPSARSADVATDPPGPGGPRRS